MGAASSKGAIGHSVMNQMNTIVQVTPRLVYKNSVGDGKGSTPILLTIIIIAIKYFNRRSLLLTKDSNPGTLLEPLKTILKSLAGTFHLRLNLLLLKL